jgi:uncharacterized protein (TIGR02996 family)
VSRDNERRGLLDSVAENPGDDTPRLVYADWLDENGEPNRAEFIRAQIRLSGLKPWGEGYTELDIRCRELLRVHQKEWLGSLPPVDLSSLNPFHNRVSDTPGWETFERGFPARVQMQSAEFVRDHDKLFRSPIRGVAFHLDEKKYPTGYPNYSGIRRLRDIGFLYLRDSVQSEEAGRCLKRAEPLDMAAFVACQFPSGGFRDVLETPALSRARSIQIMAGQFDSPDEPAEASTSLELDGVAHRETVDGIARSICPLVSREAGRARVILRRFRRTTSRIPPDP